MCVAIPFAVARRDDTSCCAVQRDTAWAFAKSNLTGAAVHTLSHTAIYPASHYVTPPEKMARAVQEIRHFADHVIAERGVRHGRLVLVPADERTEPHSHGATAALPHGHLHVRRR